MVQDTAVAARPVMFGILLTCTGFFLFACHDAVIKLLTESVTVWQIMFFRSLTIVIACLALGRGRLLRRAVVTNAKKALLGRCVVIMAAWLLYYNAARDLQLAELITIYFATPIMVSLLAIPLLGESLARGRWVPVVVGFGGVLVASGLADFRLGLPAAMAFGAACLWAWATIQVRQIALREPTSIQMLYTNSFLVVACGTVLSFFYWHTPNMEELAMLLAVGVLGGLAQFTMFEGLRYAPATIVAPFQYSSLIWAFLLGWSIWGDWPRQEVFIGAAIIFASGLLAVLQQRRR